MNVSYNDKLKVLRNLDHDGFHWYSEGLEYVDELIDNEGLNKAKPFIDEMFDDFLLNIDNFEIEIMED